MGGKSRKRQLIEAEATLQARLADGAYSPAVGKRVTEFAMLGATNEEIAAFIGIAVPTFETWLAVHPKMQAALANGREAGLARVAKSMHRLATGYKYREKRVRRGSDGSIVERVEVIKEQPPSQAAGAFLLTNRRGQSWRDRKVVDAADVLDLGELVREALARSTGDSAKVVEGEAIEVEEPKPAR